MLEVQFLDSNGDPVDLTGATLINFKLAPPDGTATLSKTGALSTNGVDGKVRYATASGDLSKIGDWQWQVLVTTPTFGPRASRVFFLTVFENL